MKPAYKFSLIGAAVLLAIVLVYSLSPSGDDPATPAPDANQNANAQQGPAEVPSPLASTTRTPATSPAPAPSSTATTPPAAPEGDLMSRVLSEMRSTQANGNNAAAPAPDAATTTPTSDATHAGSSRPREDPDSAPAPAPGTPGTSSSPGSPALAAANTTADATDGSIATTGDAAATIAGSTLPRTTNAAPAPQIIDPGSAPASTPAPVAPTTTPTTPSTPWSFTSSRSADTTPPPSTSASTTARPSTATTPATTPGPAAASAGTYTIASGDTFSSIAEKTFGSSRHWVDIAQANPTVDPNRLSVGQTIKLPSAAEVRAADAAGTATAADPARATPPPNTPPGSSTYIVRDGDTLSSIAQRFYGDPNLWDRIHQANRAAYPNPDRVPSGATLVIPPKP